MVLLWNHAEDFPDRAPLLKIGFLNVNFIKQWPLGVESAKKVIDFAN